MAFRKVSLACGLSILVYSGISNGEENFTVGGFIKYDAIFSQYSDAERAGNVGDDFLVPATIAVGDGSGKGDQKFDSNGKFSRLNTKITTDTENGTITSFLEIDFNGGNDERLTNQASNGLRHAFFKWDQTDGNSILAGQTWTTLFNTSALPEAVDFIGPTSGTLFVRQPQVRFTQNLAGGKLMLAAENPSVSFYDGGHGSTSASNNKVDDSPLPDFIARYDGKTGSFSYSAAMVARTIGYSEATDSDSTNGVGFTVSGKYALTNGNDFKFMYSSGHLGRYIALNTYRDGAINLDGNINLNRVSGGYLAYKHKWNEKMRSTFMYATSTGNNAESIVSDVTKQVSNWNLNLMYSPIKKLTFGAEYQVAQRETEAGIDGDLTRLQFTSKYAF